MNTIGWRMKKDLKNFVLDSTCTTRGYIILIVMIKMLFIITAEVTMTFIITADGTAIIVISS